MTFNLTEFDINISLLTLKQKTGKDNFLRFLITKPQATPSLLGANSVYIKQQEAPC